MAVEDHGGGSQFVRFRWRPHGSRGGILLAALFAALTGGAAAAGAWVAGTILAAATLVVALCGVLECARAAALIARAVGRARTGGV